MTNHDNNALPELPEPVQLDEEELGGGVCYGYTASMMRAYGELCRAAPAGGDDSAEGPLALNFVNPLDAPAGSGEVEDWLLDGCLIYRLSDGRNQTNTHEINVTMWDGSRELAVRDKAAAALLRKLQRGADRQVLPEGWRVSIERGIPGVMWLELNGPKCSTSAQAWKPDDVQWRIYERFEAALAAASQGQEGGK